MENILINFKKFVCFFVMIGAISIVFPIIAADVPLGVKNQLTLRSNSRDNNPIRRGNFKQRQNRAKMVHLKRINRIQRGKAIKPNKQAIFKHKRMNTNRAFQHRVRRNR
jgi:hypothetical protein